MVSLSSNAITYDSIEDEVFTDCDAVAYAYADYVYNETDGDGFAAGRAFEVAHSICTNEMQ